MLVQRGAMASPFMPDLVKGLATPILIYDERRLDALLEVALDAQQIAGFNLLYAVKASAFSDILQSLAPRIDGFAVSSLFEARLIRDLFPHGRIHFTTPGLRADEVSEVGALCDFVSFNSRTQLNKFGAVLSQTTSLGIRVNTRVSSVADPRYDPCRANSKLGVPIEELAAALESSPANVEGLHIHTNADSTDFRQLLANVDVLTKAVPEWFEFKWVNLGGGYLFEDSDSLDPLIRATELLRRRFGAQVFLEPGAALVRAAGFLVSSVVDLFDVDGARIAVLDTTVNHMPEVLEFSYKPDVIGQLDGGPYEYILAGSTCLAGDVFGTYRFATPLEIGCKVIFEEAGAYTLSKAHRFNGINLPNIGVLSREGECRVRKTSTYRDFERQWMANV